MGILKSAFNSVARLHSRAVIIKRPGIIPLYSPARATPSNYFRYLSGPSETVIPGLEFVIPISTMTGTQVQLISFNQVPTTGTWKLTYNGNSTADLNFDADHSTIQSALRLVAGLENVTVAGDYSAGVVVTMFGIQVPLQLASTITGLDATVSIKISLSGVLFSPLILRGDKFIDGTNLKTVKLVMPMVDIGGDIMAYRIQVE